MDTLLPGQLRHGMWLSVIVISAVAAATLTVTASGAQTRSPFSPAARLTAPAEDDDDPGAQADGTTYGFEQPGDLRGWNAKGAGPVVDDTAVARGGERSLGVAIDADAHAVGQGLDVTATLSDLTRPPTIDLSDATLTCYVHVRGSADGSTLLGSMFAVDGGKRKDLGARVAVTDDRWTALTMVVGAVDEPSADGRPVRQDAGFDGRDLERFGVRLRAASGRLPQALNIDDCTVRPSDGDTQERASAAGATPDARPVAPVAPAPAPAPRPAPAPDADRPDEGRDGGGRPSGGGTDDGGGGDGPSDVLSYDFEDGRARRGWTAQDGTLRLDSTIALSGSRSLGVVPGDDPADRIAVRALLSDLNPAPEFPLAGARLACHVRGVPSDASDEVYAVLVAEDGGGGQDAGTVAELTGDWSVVSLVVGSGTPDPDRSFDPEDVVGFTVHVAAAAGALPTNINIDDCAVTRAGASTS